MSVKVHEGTLWGQVCSFSPVPSTVQVGPLKKKKEKTTTKNIDRVYITGGSINGTPILENCLVFLNICGLYNLRVIIEWNVKYLSKKRVELLNIYPKK